MSAIPAFGITQNSSCLFHVAFITHSNVSMVVANSSSTESQVTLHDGKEAVDAVCIPKAQNVLESFHNQHKSEQQKSEIVNLVS